jgi:SAM-dependent methyltransferase
MATEPFLISVPDDWAVRFFDDGFEPTFRRLGKYDSTHDDLDNLIRLLHLEPPARILDVPCGFGRHAGLLAECGFTVAGIDISSDQINQARRAWPAASFEVRDMRNPPEGPFDAILCLWSSFGFLESRSEDVRALTSWRNCLAPGGILVMELTTLERAQFENRSGNEAVSFKRVERNGVLEEAWYDWKAQYSSVRYSRPGWSRECRTRMYSRNQLTDALIEAGFCDIRMTGDFRGGPLRPANRTIFMAAAAPDEPERTAISEQ